jgi:hypothetical protein
MKELKSYPLTKSALNDGVNFGKSLQKNHEIHMETRPQIANSILNKKSNAEGITIPDYSIES